MTASLREVRDLIGCLFFTFDCPRSCRRSLVRLRPHWTTGIDPGAIGTISGAIGIERGTTGTCHGRIGTGHGTTGIERGTRLAHVPRPAYVPEQRGRGRGQLSRVVGQRDRLGDNWDGFGDDRGGCRDNRPMSWDSRGRSWGNRPGCWACATGRGKPGRVVGQSGHRRGQLAQTLWRSGDATGDWDRCRDNGPAIDSDWEKSCSV